MPYDVLQHNTYVPLQQVQLNLILHTSAMLKKSPHDPYLPTRTRYFE